MSSSSNSNSSSLDTSTLLYLLISTPFDTATTGQLTNEYASINLLEYGVGVIISSGKE